MLRLGQERETLDVVSDRVGSPVYSADLVAAVMNILGRADLQRNYSSTYHYANEGVCSWYDFATAIMKLAKLPCRILPVESSAFKVAGPRSWYSVLNISAIKRDWGLVVPYWQDSLAQAIERMLLVS
jgi:dTDP-4-dehydrorhamnose reductase